MKHMLATILDNTQVATGTHMLRLRAPHMAAIAEAGQFVHVRCGQSSDPLLRRPLSLHRIGRLTSDLHSSDIALLFQVIGKGTGALSTARIGDSLDLLGPLGQGFTIEPGTRRLLLVAGGLGIAPLVAAADAAIKKDIEVTLLAGARSAANLLPAQWLPAEVEYVVSTEDGSLGQRGLVTESLPAYLAWPDQVFVCGPRAMLPTIKRHASGRAARFQVSLEERMACGMGACLGCVVETRHGLQRVCRDGPVFELGELRL
jgi:dihydroorotate dehydrogenase electron transfer subunit